MAVWLGPLPRALLSQIPWQRECQCDMKIDAFSKQIVWDDNDENAFALGRVRYLIQKCHLNT